MPAQPRDAPRHQDRTQEHPDHGPRRPAGADEDAAEGRAERGEQRRHAEDPAQHAPGERVPRVGHVPTSGSASATGSAVRPSRAARRRAASARSMRAPRSQIR